MIVQEKNVIREITPLSEKDCFYIADRRKSEFTYPMHCHKEFELNFVINAPGVQRIVGDSAEVIGDYDLVLITSPDLEHVWEQHDCTSKDVREITIQFSPQFMKTLLATNQFARVSKMFDKAQNGLCFPVSAIMKVYSILDKLPDTKGFYAVTSFLTFYMNYQCSPMKPACSPVPHSPKSSNTLIAGGYRKCRITSINITKKKSGWGN